MKSLKSAHSAATGFSNESGNDPVAATLGKREVSGFHLALIANILWGTSFLASKQTLLAWGPLTASALRFAVALLAMTLLFSFIGLKLKMPKSRNEIFWLATVSLSGFGFLYPLQLTGLKFISSGMSAAIMLTSPLFVVGLSVLLLKQSVSILKLFSLGLGIVGGCVLLFPNANFISTTEFDFFQGSMLTLAASFFLALSVIATRKASVFMDSANLTFWSMLLGLVLLLPLSTYEIANGGLFSPSWSSFLSLLYLSIVCSALCFFLWNKAIIKSTPNELASTMHIKTPTAVILGCVLASEPFSLSLLVGGIVVSLGVWLSQKEQVRKK